LRLQVANFQQNGVSGAKSPIYQDVSQNLDAKDGSVDYDVNVSKVRLSWRGR
jgi:hypothetical protein